MLRGLDKHFERKEDGRLYFIKRLWVSAYGNLRTLIMNESYATNYSIHPGADKMYYDLRDLYWWPRMKKDIALRQLLQKALGTRLDLSTTYHPETDGQSERTIQSSKDMLRAYAIEWKLGYSPTVSRIFIQQQLPLERKMCHFEALYRRNCRMPIAWAELGESKLIGPEIVQETTDKIVQIKERLKTTRDHQKSYADNRRKPLEFGGDKLLLKVSPWKGVVRFGKRSKLLQRYVGPFEIVERVGGPVAYRLRLPQELVVIHDTFHVSNLKKCLADVNLHVPLEEIKIDDKLRFVKEPIGNLDLKSRSLNEVEFLLKKFVGTSDEDQNLLRNEKTR
ncbi:putative reverse transcriptase domain-containing protein [Tanacetum coccineum]